MKHSSINQEAQETYFPISNSTPSDEGRRHLPKKKRSAYYISVDGVSVPVSEEVYDTYHYYKRTLCLCHSCVSSFFETGSYYIKRANPLDVETDICTYCNRKRGYDYLIREKLQH